MRKSIAQNVAALINDFTQNITMNTLKDYTG